jgi:hypothetical protein
VLSWPRPTPSDEKAICSLASKTNKASQSLATITSAGPNFQSREGSIEFKTGNVPYSVHVPLSGLDFHRGEVAGPHLFIQAIPMDNHDSEMALFCDEGGNNHDKLVCIPIVSRDRVKWEAEPENTSYISFDWNNLDQQKPFGLVASNLAVAMCGYNKGATAPACVVFKYVKNKKILSGINQPC